MSIVCNSLGSNWNTIPLGFPSKGTLCRLLGTESIKKLVFAQDPVSGIDVINKRNTPTVESGTLSFGKNTSRSDNTCSLLPVSKGIYYDTGDVIKNSITYSDNTVADFTLKSNITISFWIKP